MCVNYTCMYLSGINNLCDIFVIDCWFSSELRTSICVKGKVRSAARAVVTVSVTRSRSVSLLECKHSVANVLVASFYTCSRQTDMSAPKQLLVTSRPDIIIRFAARNRFWILQCLPSPNHVRICIFFRRHLLVRILPKYPVLTFLFFLFSSCFDTFR